jgi:hypothetical protein
MVQSRSAYVTDSSTARGMVGRLMPTCRVVYLAVADEIRSGTSARASAHGSVTVGVRD